MSPRAKNAVYGILHYTVMGLVFFCMIMITSLFKDDAHATILRRFSVVPLVVLVAAGIVRAAWIFIFSAHSSR
jgi:membrane protein CcdC involved in cytochrome C biogenesis